MILMETHLLLNNDAIRQTIPSVGLRLKFESAFVELVPTCETSKLPRSGTSDDVEEVDQCKATEKPNENLLIATINLKESVVKEHSREEIQANATKGWQT